MCKVLFLLADSLITPCGGLGERFRNLLPLLRENHQCAVFCYGSGGEFLDIPVRGLEEYGLPFKGGGNSYRLSLLPT